MRTTNSGFFTLMQADAVNMALLIDLEVGSSVAFHWTSANNELTYTLSSAPTVYKPFPGQTLNGLRQTSDLTVSVIDFIVANTGDLFGDLMDTKDLDYATLKIGRVHTSTPDLHRMNVFQGQIGDYSYDRNAISGSVRNQWGSRGDRFPYYNYQDKCVWRFGGRGCGFDTTSVTISYVTADIIVGSTDQIGIRFVNGTITNSFANDHLTFGRLTVTDGPNSGHIRTIRAHSGDQILLSHNLPVNSFSTFGFDVFPGCRKRKDADCTSKYDNAANFMGFPWIPIQEDAF